MGLLKLIGKAIIVLTTIAVFFILGIIFLIKFRDESEFSQLLKREIIKNPFLVHTINLNQPGDGRYIYLNPNTSFITVNLTYLENFKPNHKSEIWIKKMIEETLGKDIYFQQRFQECGGTVWLEPDVSIKHWGVKAWEGNYQEYLLEQSEKAKEEAKLGATEDETIQMVKEFKCE